MRAPVRPNCSPSFALLRWVQVLCDSPLTNSSLLMQSGVPVGVFMPRKITANFSRLCPKIRRIWRMI